MKLRAIFAKALRQKPEKITDDLERANMPRWDSLRHIELVVAIEAAYSIKLSMQEIHGLQSFAEATKLLTARGIEP